MSAMGPLRSISLKKADLRQLQCGYENVAETWIARLAIEYSAEWPKVDGSAKERHDGAGIRVNEEREGSKKRAWLLRNEPQSFIEGDLSNLVGPLRVTI